MRLTGGQRQFEVSAKDIRVYQSDHVTPCAATAAIVNERLERGNAEVILTVGLSRRFKKAVKDPPFHSLQVNNIHFEGDSVWPLG
jgi:hypothetical protein